jgi:hypothetical protein
LDLVVVQIAFRTDMFAGCKATRQQKVLCMFPSDARRIGELATLDPSFRRVGPDILARAMRDLDATRSADAFRLQAMRVMALGGNGHSRAIANRTVRVVPLRLVWLGDGPCVASGPYRGARVVSMNGSATADVFRTIRPLLAGTDQRARALAGFMFAWPPAVAFATGCAGAPRYVLEMPDGNRADLHFHEAVPGEGLYPIREPGVANELIAAGGLANADEARTGVFLRVLGGASHYVRIGDLAAKPAGAIAVLLDAILVRLAGARHVIVDLRGNPGGNFTGASGFTRKLRTVAPVAKVAVLVDKFTFSAAISTAALLKVHAGARIIGEEMGDGERFYAEGGLEELPQSGLAVRYSDGWHDWAEGRADPELTPPSIAAEMVGAGSLLPDIQVSVQGCDLISGRDAALECALAEVSF